MAHLCAIIYNHPTLKWDDTMFTTVCPGCEATLNAPDTLKGKKVKCKKCGEPFVADPAVESDDGRRPLSKTVKMPAPAKPPKKLDDEDEPTEESPPLRRAKAGKRPASEDTEVMNSADDDAGEPKRKKKGKAKSKKKERSPMLLVLIIVGAVVVLGGGSVGAYIAFFSDGDKPTTPSGTTGGTTTGSTPPKVAAADTSSWVEVHDADGAYRIKFPTQPVSRTEREQTPWGMAEIKTHLCLNPPETFVSAHLAIEDRMGMTDEQILDALLKIIANEAKGAIVKGTRSVTHQTFNGKEITIDVPGKKGTAVMRAYLGGNRVVFVVAGGDNVNADTPRAKAFFDSLKIE
jgi:hypothetical protein